jgi:hypothetical protein
MDIHQTINELVPVVTMMVMHKTTHSVFGTKHFNDIGATYIGRPIRHGIGYVHQ